MRCFSSKCVVSLGGLLALTTTAHAGQSPALLQLPVLMAKTWLLGYALVFLCVLLGLLAVLLPSMRKTLRRRD